MNRYLVAFIVGDFEYVEGATKEGVKVRVYAPLGKKEKGKFALDVACRTLSFFTEYFDIPYPLPKMDMVAIPDFRFEMHHPTPQVTTHDLTVALEPWRTGDW